MMRGLRPYLAALALLLSAGETSGHASLVSSTPHDGAVLAEAPAAVTLTFSEAARPLVARLSEASGATRLLPPPTGNGAELSYPLPPDLGPGSHLLSWRVTSADGHPVAGAVLFSIGAASGEIAAQDQSPRATRTGSWLSRAALLAAVIFAVGAAILPRRIAAARIMAATGLLILPVYAGFRGLDLLGQPPGALLTAAPWREAASGPPGLASALTGAALALALFPRRATGLAALLLAGLAAATAGHAATASPQILMRPAVALHVVAAAFWLGALLPLWVDLGQGGRAALARFSRTIPWALAALLASGIAIAAVQLGHVAALWSTDYGRVLAAKLALVALLLLIAAFNRFRLTRMAEAGDPRPLRRAILVELALSLPVFALIALWQFTPPPRSLPPGPAIAVQHLQSGPISARLEVAPPRAGMVALRLSDLRLSGQPLDGRPVEIELSKPAYGLGPFRHQATVRRGATDAARFLLPLDGYWVLRLKVLVSDFRVEELRDLIEIAPTR